MLPISGVPGVHAPNVFLSAAGTTIISHFIFHRDISDSALVPGNMFTFVSRFTICLFHASHFARRHWRLRVSVLTKSRRAEHRLGLGFVKRGIVQRCGTGDTYNAGLFVYVPPRKRSKPESPV